MYKSTNVGYKEEDDGETVCVWLSSYYDNINPEIYEQDTEIESESSNESREPTFSPPSSSLYGPTNFSRSVVHDDTDDDSLVWSNDEGDDGILQELASRNLQQDKQDANNIDESDDEIEVIVQTKNIKKMKKESQEQPKKTTKKEKSKSKKPQTEIDQFDLVGNILNPPKLTESDLEKDQRLMRERVEAKKKDEAQLKKHQEWLKRKEADETKRLEENLRLKELDHERRKEIERQREEKAKKRDLEAKKKMEQREKLAKLAEKKNQKTKRSSPERKRETKSIHSSGSNGQSSPEVEKFRRKKKRHHKTSQSEEDRARHSSGSKYRSSPEVVKSRRRKKRHRRSSSDEDGEDIAFTVSRHDKPTPEPSSDDEPVVYTASDGEEVEEHVVEGIVRKRINNGIVEYKIKWKGYSSSHNSWEPASNIKKHASGILRKYEDNRELRRQQGLSSSEGEDGDDSFAYDKVDDFLCKTLITEVMANYIDKPLLNEFPSEMHREFICLDPKKHKSSKGAELSNFLIDDFMEYLIVTLKMEKKCAYVPHNIFSKVHHSVQNRIPLQEEVLQYLAQMKIGLADCVFVLTSTADNVQSIDDEDERNSADHWILGVILKFKEKIVLLDSVRDHSSKPREDIFKSLALISYAMLRMENLNADHVKDFDHIYSKDCLSQKNSYDCGVFVIMYALSILLQKALKDSPPSNLCRRFIYSVVEGSENVGQRLKGIPLKLGRSEIETPEWRIRIGKTRRESLDFVKEYACNIEKKTTTKLVTTCL